VPGEGQIQKSSCERRKLSPNSADSSQEEDFSAFRGRLLREKQQIEDEIEDETAELKEIQMRYMFSAVTVLSLSSEHYLPDPAPFLTRPPVWHYSTPSPPTHRLSTLVAKEQRSKDFIVYKCEKRAELNALINEANGLYQGKQVSQSALVGHFNNTGASSFLSPARPDLLRAQCHCISSHTARMRMLPSGSNRGG